MRISTKGRYGLRVMIDLATHSQDRYVPLREISGRQNITVKYLEQIVTPLSHAELLLSHRGYCGGYKLKCSADEITVGQILEIMEGSLAPVVCLEGTENTCIRKDSCQTLGMWEELNRRLQIYLFSIPLSDLLDGTHENCALTEKTVRPDHS